MKCLSRIFFISIIFFFFCCDSPDVKEVDLRFDRFDQELFLLDKNNIYQELNDLRNQFPDFSQVFEERIIKKGDMEDYEYAVELLTFINHPDMREVYDSVASMYSNISEFKQELNDAFTLIHYVFPDIKPPKITAFFGGFNYGVITYESSCVDSLYLCPSNNIGIGFEYFFGSNSKYYKLLGYPEYLRFQKQKRFINSNVIEAWFNANFTEYLQGKDFLSKMIYKGKIMFLINYALPSFSLEDKFRFSDNQMNWVIKNENNIWKYFIENEFLYSSVEKDFRSFLNHAPYAKGMPKDSPGRIAYFIGYQIVSDYMKNTGSTVNELIVQTDSKKILHNSKYKPKK